MLPDIRVISSTVQYEFNKEEIDGIDFSSIQSNGEIEIVVEITREDNTSKLVSKFISVYSIFKKELE